MVALSFAASPRHGQSLHASRKSSHGKPAQTPRKTQLTKKTGWFVLRLTVVAATPAIESRENAGQTWTSFYHGKVLLTGRLTSGLGHGSGQDMAMQTIEVDGYVPPRTPQQGTVSLTTSAVHLGASITWLSHTGYDLWSSSAWLIGDSSGQARTVAANTAYFVPSGSLAGWYAKSASGTIDLVITGARKS